MLFDIITDEIGHASRYNYLYTLDHRRSIPDMTRSSAESEDFVNIADKSYESPMAPMTPMTPTGPMSPVSPMPPTTPMTPSGSVPPMQNTSNFTPDQWVNYIASLADQAVAEANAGMNPEYLAQKYILMGVLVGMGKSPEEAVNQVNEWESTGAVPMLEKSKMTRGYY